MTKFQTQMFYAMLTSFLVFVGLMQIVPDTWLGATYSFLMAFTVFASWVGFEYMFFGSKDTKK